MENANDDSRLDERSSRKEERSEGSMEVTRSLAGSLVAMLCHSAPTSSPSILTIPKL